MIPSETKPTHGYVATDHCGCIKGLQVDNPAHRRDVRLFVNDMMRAGLDLTRLPLEEIHRSEIVMECDECRAES